MVKRMIVVFSALALMITMVGVSSAQFAPPGFAAIGDTIMIPMKVKTTYSRTTDANGGVSSFFMDGCDQYTAGFHPWGPWKATRCTMKTQVIPPCCVMPAQMSLTAAAAPPCLPGGTLCSNIEKWHIKSPGCNPCVTGPYKYEMIKKQAVQ